MQSWKTAHECKLHCTPTNTNYTHCIHRMRLRPVKPQCQVEDLELVDPWNFEPDPTISEEEKEPQLSYSKVRHHINEDNMQLPIRTPDVQFFFWKPNNKILWHDTWTNVWPICILRWRLSSKRKHKKHQNQLIQEIMLSQTTQFSYRPIVLLAQIDHATFTGTIIWHWPK